MPDSKKNKPVVSICLTTFNRAQTLSQTIDSILAQTFSNFELIISDDNSNDNTEAVCRSYELEDSRVKYFKNKSNLRMPGNLNAAIGNASCEYIANLHDGDIYKPELIGKWFSTLEKHKDALFVFNEYIFLNEKGEFLQHYRHGFSEVNDGIELIRYFLKTHTSAPWGTVMARRIAYTNYGIFDAEFGFISDVEMWLRLGLNGKFCYISEALIDLAPRERSHPYFLPHWKVFLINTRILFEYYIKFCKQYPQLLTEFPMEKIVRKTEQIAIKDLLVLAKYRNFKRFREGMSIFRFLPFKRLEIIASAFWFLRSDVSNLYNDITLVRSLYSRCNDI